MKIATVRSVCECQAQLEADLGQSLEAIAGRARRTRHEPAEIAPANRIGSGEVFEVGWFCPFCIRNTLRLFSLSGLMWRDVPEPVLVTEAPTATI